MRRLPYVALTATGVLVVAACNPFGPHGTPYGRSAVHQVGAPQAAAGMRWAARLAAPGPAGNAAAGRGTATMTGGSDDPTTYVSVDLLHAAPAGEHPWQLRRGRCGADDGAFGPADAYRVLRVDAEGRASSSATISLPTLRGGRYYVAVGASAAHPDTSVACGDLAITDRPH
jgi:hypothetical protein